MKTAAVRRFWIDTRFLVGLLLVGASVAGVVAVVSAADTSTGVYTAREPLTQGQVVSADDLVLSNVRVGGAGSLYLLEGEIPPDGLVLTRPVAEGELVPASAVGSSAGLRYASIVVALNGRLPGAVGPGSLVDLWSSRELEAGGFGPPAVLVSSATVVRVLDDEGLVVSDTTAGVELLVPRAKIARLLEAIANDDALSLVPATLPAKG